MWKAIFEVIKALPQLFKLYEQWERAKLRRIQAEEERRRKNEIEQGIATGDTDRIEQAIGSENAGLPAREQTGVRTRPVRKQP